MMTQVVSAVVGVLLVFLANSLVVSDATKHVFKVKQGRVKFTVHYWDDGRQNPYRISFKKNGVRSSYRFEARGYVTIINVDGVVTTFTWDAANDADAEQLEGTAPTIVSDLGDRLLLDQFEKDAGTDGSVVRRRLYYCDDCEDTWETMCGLGINSVCFFHYDTRDWGFTDDTVTSIARLCKKFSRACDKKDAEDVCSGTCEERPSVACTTNPCQNGASCAVDIGGGHVCSCSSGYGGMLCETATSGLSRFYIEFRYTGDWTNAHKAMFQSAADRWAEVITHVPCDGTAGRLRIFATLGEIDGEGNAVGVARPGGVWFSCPGVSYSGEMTFDVADMDIMESTRTLESVILHEMGHVIGVGSLWLDCSTCRTDGDPNWKCPAVLSAYHQLGGSGDAIIELDGGSGTSCVHFDEDIFQDEIMSGSVNFGENPISKITAASLHDTGYIVDPAAVDDYTLPAFRIISGAQDDPGVHLSEVLVDTMLDVADDDGNVIGQRKGVMIQF